MSLVTKITGWISLDAGELEDNKEVLRTTKYDDDFINMFSIPEDTGTKGSYAVFGASINFCNLELWLERFEDLYSKLWVLNAIVFIVTEDDMITIYGYNRGVSAKVELKYLRDFMLEHNHIRGFPAVFGSIVDMHSKLNPPKKEAPTTRICDVCHIETDLKNGMQYTKDLWMCESCYQKETDSR